MPSKYRLLVALALGSLLSYGGWEAKAGFNDTLAVDSSALVDFQTEYFSRTSTGGWGFQSTKLTRPALTQFYFVYSGTDHHVAALIAGHFFDGSRLRWERSDNAFYDNSMSRDFAYNQQSRQLPDGTIFCQATSDAWRRLMLAKCDQPLPSDLSGYVRVLTGFWDIYQDGQDHHISRFTRTTYPDGGPYHWHAGIYDNSSIFPARLPHTSNPVTAFAFVPKAYVKGTYTVRGRSSGYSATKTINATYPVLMGWWLEFRNGDHHIKRVGVRVNPSYVQVHFADKNGDDDFDWIVEYADLQIPTM